MKNDVTQLLECWRRREPGADDALLEAVYGELRALAIVHFRGESERHTLQPTAVVHEAYLRLRGQQGVAWRSRGHFFAVASGMMRRLLVDHARGRRRAKRGGGLVPLPLDAVLEMRDRQAEDVLAMHRALSALAAVDPERAAVVEMRFFGGLTVEEVAEALGRSPRTVARLWLLAKAWLSESLKRPV